MSKAHLDISYKEIGGQITYLGCFSNDSRGYCSFVKELKDNTEVSSKEWIVCFENTGVYSKSLLKWLLLGEISCREESALRIHKSSGIKRGKSDKIDSAQITRYVFEKRDSIEPTQLSAPEITRLKQLLSRRDFVVRQKQSCQVSIKESISIIDDDLAELFNVQNQKVIELYDLQIKAIEQKIEEIISGHKEMHNNYKLAKSVVGVGSIIAAYIIACTDNFTSFENARQFASYSGIAPFPNQSGSRKGKSRVNHMANKKIKSLLSNGAISAIIHDKQIQAYYNKKRHEGKPKGVIINAIKNKLIQRVFSVVKRKTPYVKLHNYA